MAINPKDLLMLATRQAEHSGEAWRRSAVSRAYYASFHQCLQWHGGKALDGEQVGYSRGGVHRHLLDQLSERGRGGSRKQKRQCKRLSHLMREQRQRRVAADYAIDKEINADQVNAQLDDARSVFETCAW